MDYARCLRVRSGRSLLRGVKPGALSASVGAKRLVGVVGRGYTGLESPAAAGHIVGNVDVLSGDAPLEARKLRFHLRLGLGAQHADAVAQPPI